METPSQKLAQQIIEKLLTEKLLLQNDEKTTIAKLCDGTMKSEDWRLAIEKAIDKDLK